MTRPVAAGERGATTVEFALIVLLVMLVIIATVTLLGQRLAAVFTGVVEAAF